MGDQGARWRRCNAARQRGRRRRYAPRRLASRRASYHPIRYIKTHARPDANHHARRWIRIRTDIADGAEQGALEARDEEDYDPAASDDAVEEGMGECVWAVGRGDGTDGEDECEEEAGRVEGK